MKVTQIEELSKARSRVYLDEEAAFVLYRGELRSFQVRQGEDLEQESYEAIMTQVLPRRAKQRAMHLLKNRDYTVKQLRDKLKEGGYPDRVIQEALDYVGSYRYTDDLRYALGFISSHAESRSRRRLEQDLLGRGIERETLEKAWEQWEEQGGNQDEEAMIRELLEKKHFDPQRADQRERQRVYAFLMRKGFSGELVRRAVLSDIF
jgi:regulatory protein